MGPTIITAFLWMWLIISKYDNYWSRALGTAFLKSLELSSRHSCENFFYPMHLNVFWQKRNQLHCGDSFCDRCLSGFCEIQDKFCFQKVVRCEILENQCSNYTWLLGVSEFLPVISSIPCRIWAISSVVLCMMLLIFLKIVGVKLLLCYGDKWNLAHIFCIFRPICIYCQCAKLLCNAFSICGLLWK